MIRKNYRRKRNSVRKSTRKSSRRSSVSSKVKRYVKREIHRNIEDKMISNEQVINFGSVANAPNLNVIPVMPYPGFSSIPQNVTASGRVGNKIRIKRVMLNYVLTPTAYDATINNAPGPMIAQLFLANVKPYRGLIPSTTAGDFNQIVQVGSSTAPLAGTLSDLCCELNTDYWDMKKVWTHKVGFADYAGTGANAAAQYRSNNDYKLNHVKKLNITKYCPAQVTFNDGTNQQLGPNLFFMFQCVASGGGTIGSTQQPLRINYWFHIKYEDA